MSGWVTGIVAAVTKRGRAFGVAAIVLEVLTWLIASTMMFGALLLTDMG